MTISTETLNKRRYQFMIVTGIIFLLFQLISLSFISNMAILSKDTIDVMEKLGAISLLLIIGFSFLYLTAATKNKPNLLKPLKDELVKSHLQRASTFGYRLMILLTFLIFCLLKIIPFTTEDVLRIILAAGVSAPYFRFAYLEAKHA